MKLEGKKALITGGNSGIGLATAKLFIEEGAQVAITGRNQKTLDDAVALLGPKATAYRVELTDSAARKNFFAKLADDFGNLDIVFANAGIPGQTMTGNADETVFEEILRVNVASAFFTVQYALPLLKDGSSIVFNGSVGGYIGYAGNAAYAASKAGLYGMARCMAADLAPRGIRVNVMAPGAINTPIWSRVSRSAEEAAKMEKFLPTIIPLGRVGQAEEIAKAVLFLASDDGSYVNATELVVDGGLVGTPLGGSIFR